MKTLSLKNSLLSQSIANPGSEGGVSYGSGNAPGASVDEDAGVGAGGVCAITGAGAKPRDEPDELPVSDDEPGWERGAFSRDIVSPVIKKITFLD